MFDAEKVTELIAEARAEAATHRRLSNSARTVNSKYEHGDHADLYSALADALDALSSLRDAEPAEGRLERLSPDFRADLVDAARVAITQVWADVPGGVDAATLASNVVMAQEFFWLSRQAPVRDAEPEWEAEWLDSLLHDDTYEYTHSSDCDGSNVKHWRRTPRFVRKAGPWLPTTEGADRG